MSDNSDAFSPDQIRSWMKEDIFQTAFTHRSFLNESDSVEESNERLEFLGDAVLSFIVSSFLYKLRNKDTEGALTNLRSYIVKTTSLARAAKLLDLGSFLRMSKGEELSGGRDNIQLMANTYEALLGATYLHFGIEQATLFVMRTLIPLFEEEIRTGPPKDAKSLLQEVSQTLTKQSPKYKIIDTKGPDHAKEFSVGVFIADKRIAEGSGLSKQVAEEEAASKALDILFNEHPELKENIH